MSSTLREAAARLLSPAPALTVGRAEVHDETLDGIRRAIVQRRGRLLDGRLAPGGVADGIRDRRRPLVAGADCR